MTQNMERFIEGLKNTNFYKTTISALYVSEHDPETVYYTANRIHQGAEVDAATEGLASSGILLEEVHILDEDVDTTSMLVKSTLQEIK